ncbi:MAG: Mur ligase family protein [Patescibacteria group bacterium]|nr:Mur ligase family protein [Patescibacteria group bacterium]
MKFLAILVGKLAALATRLTKTGSGTTLPGLMAEKIEPQIIRKIAERLKYGVIVVTGTNGKTTTSKMLVEILSEEGYTVLHNPSGSNLTRGIASALIHSVNIFGTGLEADIAVFEVDEATMPEATTKLRPRAVLLTNLFRDQLDRYGELDKTAAIIGNSLRGFSEMTTILNADDPLVSSLAKYSEGEVVYFGVEDQGITTDSGLAMDSKDCIACGHELVYEERYLGHLGKWHCENCKEKRQKPLVSASSIKVSPFVSKFELALPKENLKVEMPIPGLYNVYNALAAATAATVTGVGAPAISHTLRNCEAAFGRMELIEVEGKKIMVLLIKNPTGANQALSAIYSDGKPKKVGLFLNDNFADGTDVSWIWDIDFEYFKIAGSEFVASGIRGEDMALRLKYAGVDKKNYKLEKDINLATKELAKKLKKDEIGYLLPTYTAMIEIRNNFTVKSDELCNMGKVTKRGL